MFLSISDLSGTSLEWKRDRALNRAHVLSSQGGLVGRLSFAGMCGSLATGETAHGAWTFKREGFLHPRVTIRRAGSDVTIGVLAVTGSGRGTLTLPGGEEYRLTTSGWSRSRWSFERGAEAVVRFERISGGAAVTIANRAASPDAEDAAVIAATTAAICC